MDFAKDIDLLRRFALWITEHPSLSVAVFDPLRGNFRTLPPDEADRLVRDFVGEPNMPRDLPPLR